MTDSGAKVRTRFGRSQRIKAPIGAPKRMRAVFAAAAGDHAIERFGGFEYDTVVSVTPVPDLSSASDKLGSLATYAVGDIQGCFLTLERLLAKIGFAWNRDRLWVAGDLVNRGPQSLEVLRFMHAHREQVQIVLGNHDLHLLAIAAGIRRAKKRDTLDALLRAPDRQVLLDWLVRQPLLVREGAFVMVHGGVHPAWTIDEAQARAREAEVLLQSESLVPLLGDRHPKRAAETVNVLTRIRMVDKNGGLADYDGPPADAPRGLVPWYAAPGRKSRETTIIFGHWAALGRRIENGVIALDSGCVWGGALSAVRLDDRAAFEEPCADVI